MIKVAQLLFPLGSPRGGHLVDLHDTHISSFLATLLGVPHHAPYDAPCDFPRDTYLSVACDPAHGERHGGPRDKPRVDSHADPPDVQPKTPSCTKQDNVPIPTTYQTTNSSDSERARKSVLESALAAYREILNIAILTPVGDALFPSSFDSSTRVSSEELCVGFLRSLPRGTFSYA